MIEKTKIALITGISGMVGSHLCDFLLKNTDWKIFGFCRWNEDFSNIKHIFDLINRSERVSLIYGDLNDMPSVQRAVNESSPDYVFHLAAQSYPQTSFSAPLDTLQTNIIGTANLLESIKNADCDPIVHICSSSEVFGRVKKESLPIVEDCNFHPASPYAISKVGTDLLGRFYAEAYGIKTVTTRMFTHTGPRRGDVFAESTFCKQIAMIEAGLQDPVIKVGNLESLRTWSDVRDAVRAYYMLVTINPVPGEYYNIGGSFSCSVRDMLDYLISLSTVDNISVEIDKSRLRPIDADLQVPCTDKFKKHTGWEPKINFEKTMLDLLNYWRNRVNREETFLLR